MLLTGHIVVNFGSSSTELPAWGDGNTAVPSLSGRSNPAGVKPYNARMNYSALVAAFQDRPRAREQNRPERNPDVMPDGLRPMCGPPRLLLTSREAAAALSISERTLWQLKEDGKIPFVLFGRNVRYNLSSLEEWIREQERASIPPQLRRSREEANGQPQHS